MRNLKGKYLARKAKCGRRRVGAILFESVGIRILSDCRVSLYSLLIGFLVAAHNILCAHTAWCYWDTNRVSSLRRLVLQLFRSP